MYLGIYIGLAIIFFPIILFMIFPGEYGNFDSILYPISFVSFITSCIIFWRSIGTTKRVVIKFKKKYIE